MTDTTDPTGRDQGPCLADHQITGVGLGQDKGQAVLSHQLDQRLSILDGCGKRLVADNGNASAQKVRGHRGMQVIGRSDRYSVRPNYRRWPAPDQHHF